MKLTPIVIVAAIWLASILYVYAKMRKKLAVLHKSNNADEAFIRSLTPQVYRAGLRNYFRTLPCTCSPHCAPWDDRITIHESHCQTEWGPKAAAHLEARDAPESSSGEPNIEHLRRACERKIYK